MTSNSSVPTSRTQQLLESFSVPCRSVCSNTNLSPDLQAACDTGSQAWCSSPNNINSADCQTYLQRVIAGKQASPVVAIPTSSKQTLADYYNALGTAADTYVQGNINSADKLMGIIGAEQGTQVMFNKVADDAIASCVASSDNSCSNVAWLTTRVTANLTAQATTMANADIPTILGYITTNMNHYTKFMGYYAPIHDLILKKITVADLVNPTLISLRNKSAYMLNGIDLFVLNQITNGKLTSIPLNKDGSYNVDITNNVALYGQGIRAFYKAILASPPASTDQLGVLIAKADTTNKNTFDFKTFALSALSKAMYNTGEPNLVPPIKSVDTKIQASIASTVGPTCGSTTLYSDPMCATYANNLTSDADKTKFYTALLTAMYDPKTGYNNDNSKNILKQYPGLSAWLVANTVDKVSTDAQGNTTIVSGCGGTNILSSDQCNQLAAIFPNMTTTDQIQRCALPNYRYEGNPTANTFQSRENFDQDYEYTAQNTELLWFIAILILAVLLIGYKKNILQYICNCSNKMSQPTTIPSKT